MSWRDNLQQASFRGIPFEVNVATTGVGRRTEMNVYANTQTGTGKKYQDYVWAKDLGAEPDSFTIEGYVIQNITNNFDHFPERDNLIKALKTQGPGILVHPSFKEPMEVSIDGKAKEQGYAGLLVEGLSPNQQMKAGQTRDLSGFPHRF